MPISLYYYHVLYIYFPCSLAEGTLSGLVDELFVNALYHVVQYMQFQIGHAYFWFTVELLALMQRRLCLGDSKGLL